MRAEEVAFTLFTVHLMASFATRGHLASTPSLTATVQTRVACTRGWLAGEAAKVANCDQCSSQEFAAEVETLGSCRLGLKKCFRMISSSCLQESGQGRG